MSVVEEDGIESRCSLESKRQTMLGSDSQQTDGGGGLAGLCLVINNETVRIRSISVKISGLEAKQKAAKQASVEVNLTAAEGEYLSADLPNAGKAKKKSFISKIMKKSKSPRRDSAYKADGAGVSAAAAADAIAAAVSGSSADGSAGMTQQRQEEQAQQVTSGAEGPRGNGDDSDLDSSTDSEISVAALAAAAAAATAAAAAADSMGSASNTVESETAAEAPAGDAPACPEKPKSSVSKKLSNLLSRRKDKFNGSSDQLSFNFPSDLPDTAKALFQIMSDTRLITTVYASSSGPTATVKMQKKLMTDGAEKRFMVDGKPRSVWLNPKAGEQVEIWKEYYSASQECNRALGRLPGTDKYGFILPDEVDLKKDFATREEKEDYKNRLEKLVMFQNVYGNDDDEQYA